MGQGSDGVGGNRSGILGDGFGGGGGGGSSGSNGSKPSNSVSANGGLYGGGGGGGKYNVGPSFEATGAGAAGAVRIIFGDGRAFPSTNTADL